MLHDDEFFEEQKPSILKRGLYVLVALLVIFGLLGSSIAGIIYFFRRIERVDPLFAVPELAATSSPPAGSSRTQEQADSQPAPFPELALEEQSIPQTEQAVTLNRIALINSERQVETVNPDGSERRVLTDGESRYLLPTWAPDGNKIAAVGSSEAAGSIVFITDDPQKATVSKRVFRSLGTPIYLYWSPDSQQISFLANNPSVGDLELHLTSPNGSHASRRVATGSPFYWNWSADSQSMLVHFGNPFGAAENGSNLFMLGLAENEKSTPILAPGFFQAPGISANGRFWAYSQLQGGGNSWLVVDDRQTTNQLKKRHAGSTAFSWSPVANKLAFISGEIDQSHPWGALRLMDVDTGQVDVLSSDHVLAFFWSPDGQKIAFISSQSNDQNRIVNAAAPIQKQSKSLSKTIAQPSPLFKVSVVDVETGSGLLLAELSPTYLFLAQFLPFFDQYALSHRLWSPDSHALLMPIVEGLEEKIVVIDVGNGRQREIGAGSIAFWSHQ